MERAWTAPPAQGGTATSPLLGGPNFFDMSEVYAKRLRTHFSAMAKSHGMMLHEGVYAGLLGPQYETPAEVQMLQKLGADAVGMSTVPETIVARQCGLKVAAVSCITNLAAGRSRKPLSHAEVLETSERVKKLAAQMLKNFAELYGQNQ